MADVVRLQEHMMRLGPRETPRPEKPAQILLFTGVRYERLTPAMLRQEATSTACDAPDSARRN
ncbi:MAG: hypothetical protein QHC90_23985 [Shinella sp.]|jgi:hypothetical protein|nr:hypothetical protein [Shinella sp.]